jgi:flagellum-specific peptidoglycan hydrolase FlgJ
MKTLLLTIVFLMAFSPSEPPAHVTSYLNSIEADAKLIHDLYGYPLELIKSQACQESGFGTSENCKVYCNHFGITGGIYDSQIECFFQYAKVLSLPCYQNLQPQSLEEWFSALECCHYATDSNYTKSLRLIITKYL